MKSHLLGTGPTCTRTQVCGGWRCPLLGHQVHGKLEGRCPGARDGSVSPSMGQASLQGGDRGRLSLGGVLSYYCPCELMGFISPSVLWEAVLVWFCAQPGFNQHCIKCKGVFERGSLQRRPETTVPDLGCGGGRLQSKGSVCFFAFPRLRG